MSNKSYRFKKSKNGLVWILFEHIQLLPQHSSSLQFMETRTYARKGIELRTRRRNPLPRPHLRLSRCQPPRSPSPEQQDLHALPRTHLPPCLLRHTNARRRFEYIRSNLWSIRENTSAMAVVLLIMQTARMTLARSPPGTTVGGW